MRTGRTGELSRIIQPILVTLLATGSIVRAQTPLTTVLVTDGLSRPVGVTHAPGDFERLFVLQLRGQIVIVKNGSLLETPFLDIDSIAGFGPEAGLLGLAFHPDYASNGTFYIDYMDNNDAVVIARYTVSTDPDRANPDGDTVLSIPQPETNHNGGWIAFGPDGYLYIATGDGGEEQDPNNRAQDINQLYGKILRIDVDGDDFSQDELRDYAIPSDNPFVGRTGADEIWVYGLRNPWRNAFDALTGDLYITDVGENRWEEVNFLSAGAGGGANYGWRCMEGNECTGLGGCVCFSDALTLPIHAYSHRTAEAPCSIIGGEVYRGCAIPDLAGTYFFGDYCTAQVWSLHRDGEESVEVIERTDELAPGGGLTIDGITSFGRDADGEIYICDRPDGELFKIVPATTVQSATIIASDPPDGAIDAAQPFPVDGGDLEGWNTIELLFDGPAPCPSIGDFTVEQDGVVGEPPAVVGVDRVSDDRVRVRFDRPITSGAWTTLSHAGDNLSIRIGTLPGDVDADGISNARDVDALIAHLQEKSGALPIWSTDIDRSGTVTPADLLGVIDLLLGAGAFDAYDGASLP